MRSRGVEGRIVAGQDSFATRSVHAAGAHSAGDRCLSPTAWAPTGNGCRSRPVRASTGPRPG